MKTIYLVSGASGHLGSTLVKKLKKENHRIRALVLKGEEPYVDKDVEICIGNVNDIDSLERFFEHREDEEVILFHCAGIVTISSKKNPLVNKVNVEGTRNMLEMAMKHKVKKMIYVSSVHAILENKDGINSEPEEFYPEMIDDPYGRSKAAAAKLCKEYADKGLDVSTVLPSAIFGPGDQRKNNHSVISVWMMYKLRIPVGLQGGFDFVDVRDVSQGMIDCAKKGRKGQCYILSGHYLKVNDLMNGVNKVCGRRSIKVAIPYRIVRPFVPLMEKLIGIFTKKPLITPYSLAILNVNGHFSYEKASKEFGYSPRETGETLKDMIKEFEAE